MTTDDARQLFQHMEWADSMTWKALAGIPAAGDDATLLERLQHVHMVQRNYLQIWLGTYSPDMSSATDLSELQAWTQDYYRGLSAFTEELDEARLAADVEFPWREELVKYFGVARSATVQETIVQVAMHTAHHRGQLATMIRQFGGEPPLVDFIGWIWMGKPAAEWTAPAQSWQRSEPGAT